MKLKDKVAIVTGGGSGIGRGVSLAYAREGAHVVVADVNRKGADETVAMVEEAGGRGLAVQTDVADPTQVTAMVAAARAAFGRIDILFNGAGILFPTSILDTTVEQWDRTLAVNLRGNFLCLQAAAKVMVEQGRGKIINITSILGIQARAKRGAYGASKAGIISLTKTAAIELGPQGVFVNAIAPGSIPPTTTTSASLPSTRRRSARSPTNRTDGVNILIQSIVKSGSVDDTSKFEAGFRQALPMKSIQGDTLTIGGGMAHGIDHQIAAFRYIGAIKNGQLQIIGKIQ